MYFIRLPTISICRTLTELRALKANGANPNMGIDGVKGGIIDMKAEGILDPFAVRTQVCRVISRFVS